MIICFPGGLPFQKQTQPDGRGCRCPPRYGVTDASRRRRPGPDAAARILLDHAQPAPSARTGCRTSGPVHRILERLARRELDRLRGRDLDLGARRRIATDPRGTRPGRKRAEPDQLHGVALRDGRCDGAEQRVERFGGQRLAGAGFAATASTRSCSFMVMSFRLGLNAAPYPIPAPVRNRLQSGASGLAAMQPTLPIGGMAVKGHLLWGGPNSRRRQRFRRSTAITTVTGHRMPMPRCSHYKLRAVIRRYGIQCRQMERLMALQPFVSRFPADARISDRRPRQPHTSATAALAAPADSAARSANSLPGFPDGGRRRKAELATDRQFQSHSSFDNCYYQNCI